MKLKERIKWRVLCRMLTLPIACCFLTACPDSVNVVLTPPTLELNPTSINFTKSAGDSHDLSIKISNDASWQIYDGDCKDWLSISTKEGKGSMTVKLTTTNENLGAQGNGSLEVVATNDAGQTSKKVLITRDPYITEYEECKAERMSDDILCMSYGMACKVMGGTSTTTFKHRVYTAAEFAGLSGNEFAIAQEADSKTGWKTEITPSNGAPIDIMYSDLQPSTDYVLVTVAYTRDGRRGQILEYAFSTKDASEDNQARVSVTPKKKFVDDIVHDSNNGPWYEWSTNSDGKGDFYLTYACASDKLVETMKSHNNDFGVINTKIGLDVAWAILMETKTDNLENTHEVKFNKDNDNGREKIVKARYNSTQWIGYNKDDKYLQIVTWAFKGNDFSNPSGVVSDVLYHVDNGVLREVDAPIEYYVKVAPTTLSLGAVPSSAELSIDSNDSWTITSNQSWCKIDGEQTKKGSGLQKVTVTATQNESTSASRTARITITGNNSSAPVTVTVTQEPKTTVIFGKNDYDADKNLDGGQTPATYTLSVSPSTMTFVPAGAQKSITLTGNDSWTAKSSQSWCTLSKSSGSGSATITVSASKNTTTAQRTAVVTITGVNTGTKSVSVTQEPYTLTATPTSLTMENKADSKTITVSSNGQWTASSNQSWCTLSLSSATGNGSVTVRVAANTTATARTATVTIRETNSNRSTSVTVKQVGGSSIGRNDYGSDKNL